MALEPACISAFADELPNLFPGSEAAARLRGQASFFSDFLVKASDEDQISCRPLDRQVLVQVHCHHHAIVGYHSERQLLERLGIVVDVLPSGCCGMAGAFGFEQDKYELSMKLAERVLLPRVRTAPPDTIVLANGFSCREQIEQGAGVETMHVAELLSLAHRETNAGR
ncbi:hypothetical protein [Bradyrhizobium icense]|uniref:hypothetical protein n=1 Tax=Bradyrhizobium icense TaxID=1274631 RepID=UPI0018D31D38|nr:hypothetical protein [Bradyrhizobium icense]